MKNKIKILNEREHILQISGEIYLGQMTPQQREIYLYKDNKFILTTVKYVPALIKIFNEILDNSVTNWVENRQNRFTIKVILERNSFKVEDNGTGIKIEKIKTPNNNLIYAPKAVWGELRSSSNFDKEQRLSASKFGVGGSLTNLFSKYFKGISYDGNKKMVCEWWDNGNPNKYKEKITKSKKKGVVVYVEPDFKKFNVDSFSDIDFDIIKTRLIMLKLTYPEISFYFNNQKIIQPKEVIF